MTADKKGRMLGLLLLGALVAWVAMNTLAGVLHSLASERWPRTSAQVVAAAVYRDGSDVSPRWEPTVVYHYQIGSETFTSGRIRFLMGPMYRREEASRVVEPYNIGRVVRVAYDPANPRESVLEPGPPPGALMNVLLVLLLVGVTGYIYYEVRHPGRRVLLRSIPDHEV